MSFDRNWIKVKQIPEVVEQLKDKGRDSSFAVLMFDPPKLSRNKKNDINLQYSIEYGIIGLDWVSLGPRNIKDKRRIYNFLKQHRYKVLDLEMNNVRYLRIENDDIALAGIQVITEFYGLTHNEEIELLVDGFKWDIQGEKNGTN